MTRKLKRSRPRDRSNSSRRSRQSSYHSSRDEYRDDTRRPRSESRRPRSHSSESFSDANGRSGGLGDWITGIFGGQPRSRSTSHDHDPPDDYGPERSLRSRVDDWRETVDVDVPALGSYVILAYLGGVPEEQHSLLMEKIAAENPAATIYTHEGLETPEEVSRATTDGGDVEGDGQRANSRRRSKSGAGGRGKKARRSGGRDTRLDDQERGVWRFDTDGYDSQARDGHPGSFEGQMWDQPPPGHIYQTVPSQPSSYVSMPPPPHPSPPQYTHQVSQSQPTYVQSYPTARSAYPTGSSMAATTHLPPAAFTPSQSIPAAPVQHWPAPSSTTMPTSASTAAPTFSASQTSAPTPIPNTAPAMTMPMPVPTPASTTTSETDLAEFLADPANKARIEAAMAQSATAASASHQHLASIPNPTLTQASATVPVH